MTKTNVMTMAKGRWGRWLASGLLALALLVSHAMPPVLALSSAPMPDQAQMSHGDCHEGNLPTDHKPMKAAACQACQGMAVMLSEPLALPTRLAFSAYPPLSSEWADSLPIPLETPPPKSAILA
ncbi:exported hypothetical protein [Rhodospirillaceae bacterium LM-1]|nr:exported hypothetical protein [Rhodospirillaceae bacterium LM-1]